ncbi:MAG: hypothetical protein KatS3mg014_2443 [Actinomycetota bacterium]|nr:MAG: hypothetical protein KatS3mg014_2443 [Actinomycetota bacterium]
MAEVPLERVGVSDRALVRPGALFETDGTSVWVLRLPPVSDEQVGAARQRARERLRRLGLEVVDGR